MPDESVLEVLIVGAGPIGLACGISALRAGVTPHLIDAGAIAHAIYRYPIGMDFFTTPEPLEIGGHPFACAGAKPTREEALKYYRGVVRVEGLSVRSWTRFLGAERHHGVFRCRVECAGEETIILADKLVIATGYFDHPNLLGVPGEGLPHVHHWFDEAHLTTGLDVVVVGGKNSAIDCALQCYRAGARVTVVYRGTALKPTVKYWLRPDFDNRVAAGEIAVRFGAEVRSFSRLGATIQQGDQAPEFLKATRVYALTGYHPDFDLLRSLGLALDADGKPSLDPATLESDVPGIFIAGSAGAGLKTGEIFIENGRGDGDRIFGAPPQSRGGLSSSQQYPRPEGE